MTCFGKSMCGLWNSAQSVIRFFPRDRRTGSLGRFDIPRGGAFGVFPPIESGIAINAAERTDSDCAEEISLHGAAAMRSKYLGTTAMWTGPFGVRAHTSRFPL
jgi:hypothetical protein